jgi:hypothetical protein
VVILWKFSRTLCWGSSNYERFRSLGLKLSYGGAEVCG